MTQTVNENREQGDGMEILRDIILHEIKQLQISEGHAILLLDMLATELKIKHLLGDNQ